MRDFAGSVTELNRPVAVAQPKDLSVVAILRNLGSWVLQVEANGKRFIIRITFMKALFIVRRKGLEKPLPKHELPKQPTSKDGSSAVPRPQISRQGSRENSDCSQSPEVAESPPALDPVRKQPAQGEQDLAYRVLPDVMIPKINIRDILASNRTEYLLSYFRERVCPLMIITQEGLSNLMQEYILPLAHEHLAVLHGVLGLSACHMSNSAPDDPFCKTEALKHRLEATRCLKELLTKEAENCLLPAERDVILATKNMLALQDIQEFGSLSHAIPLSSAARMCEKLMMEGHQTKRTIYLLGSLATLDMMRSIPDPRTLRFSQESREKIIAETGPEFESIGGCNRELFLIFGNALERVKKCANGEISKKILQLDLEHSKQELLDWNADYACHPSSESEWKCASEAYRYAFILTILRLPHPLALPAELPEIQENVTKILDAVSQISASSPLAKKLLLPLFIAGADAISGHQRHYISIRMTEINREVNISTSGPSTLNQVWELRDSRLVGEHDNVPWNINYL
ncbi:hypothetical protein PVAG01_04928 [Phlyctema vagabunda]|uniref:Uncharacterized protein n=1 Tax=Phlyctema vagabunda TaxID=108571 RepID=A0ABR4PIL3_9HELO